MPNSTLAACLDNSGYSAACLDPFISASRLDGSEVLVGGWPSLPRASDAPWIGEHESYTYDYTYDPKFF